MKNKNDDVVVFVFDADAKVGDTVFPNEIEVKVYMRVKDFEFCCKFFGISAEKFANTYSDADALELYNLAKANDLIIRTSFSCDQEELEPSAVSITDYFDFEKTVEKVALEIANWYNYDVIQNEGSIIVEQSGGKKFSYRDFNEMLSDGSWLYTVKLDQRENDTNWKDTVKFIESNFTSAKDYCDKCLENNKAKDYFNKTDILNDTPLNGITTVCTNESTSVAFTYLKLAMEQLDKEMCFVTNSLLCQPTHINYEELIRIYSTAKCKVTIIFSDNDNAVIVILNADKW